MKKVLLVAAVLLTGCAVGPKTVNELKETGFIDSFVVDYGYQSAYRNFKESYETCISRSAFYQTPLLLNSELYTDIGEGQITLSSEPDFGKTVLERLIIIKKASDNKSNVTLYQSKESYSESEISSFRNWLEGKPTCE